MVGPQRSLVTRVYLYATIVLVASFAVAYFVGRALVDEGQGEAIREMRDIGADQAAFIGREIERSISAGAISPARLTELSESLHVELTFVPWTERGRFPAELTSEKVVVMPGPGGDRDRRRGGWRRAHWVRLDAAGRPVGAIKVEFQRPRMKRPAPPPAADLIPFRHRLPLAAAAIWMALLALMIVPPLWFWVVRPLRRMVAIADRLGHGDLATPVPIDRKDEFGELEKAFESLRQRVQQMLAARERLLRDISHELRAPLSRMAIAVPLLRDDRPSPYIDHLERDMKVMDDLIGEILALARGRSPESLQRGPVDLAEVASGLLAERGVVLDQRETPVTSGLAPAPTIGDRRLLARAMGNLFDNALKYTPDQAAVRLETATENGEAVFRVIDRGPGIRAADQPHLFEPFYRPDASRTRETGGTGLGLAIARAIAEAHGGTATLRSVEGQGTTAELRFPVEAGTTTLGS